MNQPTVIVVTDRDGVRGTIEEMPTEADARQECLVRLEDGQGIMVPLELITAEEDGTYSLDVRFSDLLNGRTMTREVDDELIVVPVIEESIQVAKRAVEKGRVRITKVVREHEEVVDEPLLQEEVEVQRVAVNRVLDEPVSVRYEGDTMIIPLLEEVLVIEKRLMLTEELHVTKRQVERSAPQEFTLRKEEVIVERLDDGVLEEE